MSYSNKVNKVNGTNKVLQFPVKNTTQELPVNWAKQRTKENYSYTVCTVTNLLVDPATKLPLQFRPAKCLDGTNWIHEMIALKELPDAIDSYPVWLHNFAHHVERNSAGIYIQPKIDGIRCIVFGGVAYSASLRRLPNVNIQEAVSDGSYDGFDGELVVTTENSAAASFRKTQSIVMSQNHTIKDLEFQVFDFLSVDSDFTERLHLVWEGINSIESPKLMLKLVETVKVDASVLDLKSLAQLIKVLLGKVAEFGGEGIVIRLGEWPYNFGRATANSPGLIKFKAKQDTEARVIGVVQGKKNLNEPQDEMDGTTSRLYQKDNFDLVETAGALRVIGLEGTPFAGKEFNVSLGSLTHAERDIIWKDRDYIIDRTATFEYFNFGDYDLPRSPLFKGFRELD